MTGGISLNETLPAKPPGEDGAWISEKAWGETFRLSKLNNFTDFIKLYEKAENLAIFR